MSKKKLKTKKSAAKRIEITATGKMLKQVAFSSHLQSKKSKSRKRRHKKKEEIQKTIQKKLKKMLYCLK